MAKQRQVSDYKRGGRVTERSETASGEGTRKMRPGCCEERATQKLERTLQTQGLTSVKAQARKSAEASRAV